MGVKGSFPRLEEFSLTGNSLPTWPGGPTLGHCFFGLVSLPRKPAGVPPASWKYSSDPEIPVWTCSIVWPAEVVGIEIDRFVGQDPEVELRDGLVDGVGDQQLLGGRPLAVGHP